MIGGVLQGMRVAILVSDGFEESELLEPRWALDQAGAATFIVSPMENKVTGFSQTMAGKQIPVEIPMHSAKADDFHALLLPGGSANASELENNREALQFAKDFVEQGKPIAAIGAGSAVLLKTGILSGRRVTGSGLGRIDFPKSGAISVNQDIVRDHNLITARQPDDLSGFIDEMMRVFSDFREHSIDMRKTA